MPFSIGMFSAIRFYISFALNLPIENTINYFDNYRDEQRKTKEFLKLDLFKSDLQF